MKRKFFNVVCWIICLVFAGTLIGTGAVLYQDYKIGQESAQEKLNKLYRQTEEAISYYQYPNSDFITAFSRAIGSADYYYSIRLETPSQQVYVFPINKTAKRGLTVTDSRRITEGNTIDLTLTVQIYTLPLSLIAARAKIAFIIILSATFVSALCLIACYLDGTSKSTIKREDDDFNFEDNTEDYSEPQVETNLFEAETHSDSQSDKTIVIENQPNDNLELSDSSDEEQAPENTPEAPAATSVPITNAAVVSAQEEEVPNSDRLPEHEDLFSSTTGFCYEKYLVQRLESELARAASGELDISLILIQVKDLDYNTSCGVDLCKQLTDIFHYKDMLFEYRKDGIAIIYSNADIDKAMESSEIIYAEYCSTLSKYNISEKPFIGIASRSLRFISGEKLITEAEQALLHAKEDPDSPIIAFRVNPEKYRKFMAQTN